MLDFAFCGSQLHDFIREGTQDIIQANWWRECSYGFAKFQKSLVVVLFCPWCGHSQCMELHIYTTKTSHELATSHSLSAWWLVIPKSCVLLIKLVSSLSQETYFTRKYLCCHRGENGVTSVKCTNFLHRRHS